MSLFDPEDGPFLNAHCHLELSLLRGAIPGGLPFVEWLQKLVPLKRDATAEALLAAAEAAWADAKAANTAALLDILTQPHDSAESVYRVTVQASSHTRCLLFREIIEFRDDNAKAALESVERRLAGLDRQPSPWLVQGISPHAPYTVSPQVFRDAARLARSRGEWLCIHAAETAEETEFLTRGTGPLHDWLRPFLPPDWAPPRLRPIPYLDSLGCLTPRTLLVHCNDVDDADLRILKARGCSVVVCPGTHVYFGRGYFPLADLLAAGIPAFLGTDSLASNEALEMRREVRLAYELAERRVPLDRLWELASARRAGWFFGRG